MRNRIPCQRDAGTRLATALRRRPFSACNKGNRRHLHAGNTTLEPPYWMFSRISEVGSKVGSNRKLVPSTPRLSFWRVQRFSRFSRVPRTASYPDVSLLMKMCAQRKAGVRQRARRRFACRLYPSHGPLRFITRHSFRARLCHAKRSSLVFIRQTDVTSSDLR